MRSMILSFCALIMLSACGHNTITPIGKLQKPPLTHIQGKVVAIDGDEGFTLEDHSGKVKVEYDDGMADFKDLRLGDVLVVKGTLDEEGDEFEAVKVRRAGECCKKDKKSCCDKTKEKGKKPCCKGKKDGKDCHEKGQRKR